jgi:hypothetical protein
MPATQPCIICQTMPYKDKHDVVYGMVHFRAHGNYGSAIYDPMNSRNHLRISICDKCLKDLATRGLVQEATVIPRPEKVTHKRWHPEEFEDD